MNADHTTYLVLQEDFCYIGPSRLCRWSNRTQFAPIFGTNKPCAFSNQVISSLEFCFKTFKFQRYGIVCLVKKYLTKHENAGQSPLSCRDWKSSISTSFTMTF